MDQITVIGAGKTGRGFAARLMKESGKSVAFVDKDGALIEKLQKAGSFRVHFFGNVREPLAIDGFTADVWEDADFTHTELILVSVGGSNLQEVGEKLHDRLPGDKNIYVITCENASDPAGVLQKAIDLPNVLVSQATVFCTTTDDAPEGDDSFGDLDINSENYPYLQYDADRFQGYEPGISTLKAVKNFGNFLQRKLYTYNAASGIIAYLGHIYGYTDYGMAAQSPVIRELLDQNYEITNRVLCRAFGFDPADQREFARLSRDKFTSTVISDTVARNAREPQRKLGPGERIIGPMKLIRDYGEQPTVLMMTAAAALLYDGDGEDRWREIRKENTPEEILIKIGGLDPRGDRALIDGILDFYKKYERELQDD